MRPHLGAGLWDEFVEHVNRHTTRRAGCARLRPHRACCAAWAALDGAPCMHAALVDLRAGAGTGVGREREVGKALERLHLDHERPLHATCHR
eukprot:scaffold6811_cov55-Phaeocystis_antarctica.AAC.4